MLSVRRTGKHCLRQTKTRRSSSRRRRRRGTRRHDHADDGADPDITFSLGSWWAISCPRSKGLSAMAAPHTFTRSRSRECMNGSRSYASQSDSRVERRTLKRTQCQVCQSHSITHLRKRILCRSSPQERKKQGKRDDGKRPPSP